MSDQIVPNKVDIEHDEKDHHILPDDLPLPEEIAHLSRDEVKALERSLTRRLDFTLMPTVFTLFLLNIL